MAQIGSFVPCKSAILPVFDGIHSRVGAGDISLKGISTFMNEMLETATLLRVILNASVVYFADCHRGLSYFD